MGTKWVLTTVGGKVAGAATDFRITAEIAGQIARLPADAISDMHCTKVSTSDLLEISSSIRWEDLLLFGSKFQKSVWKRLFFLTHPDAGKAAEMADDNANAIGNSDTIQPPSRLMSYSEFAESCGSRAGVRAVAHAVALNPIAVIIPCHLIVPKETMDRIREIESQAASSLFGSDGLRLTSNINFGEYRYGRDLKRSLILGTNSSDNM